ncbi:hypothetical protein [Brachybacterium phenoliresistens]|uniref:Oxidoreductase n=1 Tax=Brachybacterium phenoliresistens TaxID=396014 RepID=Z9JQ83_9MICO|nr:hypothetical protein [Brachybacterium phenoliresistens]EWS79946.1 oxidoreductase [Brachybacterium phenoliresistens]
MSTLYEDVGGYDGMLRLAAAWHERALADPVVAHAFSHGFRADHTERLAAYLTESIGGPPWYSESCGTESDVARLHGGNGPHEEMDRRGIGCFDAAIRDIDLDPQSYPGSRLHALWSAGTERFAQHSDGVEDIPDGLEIPRFDDDRRDAG